MASDTSSRLKATGRCLDGTGNMGEGSGTGVMIAGSSGYNALTVTNLPPAPQVGTENPDSNRCVYDNLRDFPPQTEFEVIKDSSQPEQQNPSSDNQCPTDLQAGLYLMPSNPPGDECENLVSTNPDVLTLEDRGDLTQADIDMNISTSPPGICSSPPKFEPPPLPRTLVAPPLSEGQPLTRYPFSPGVLTTTMPSAFPSPRSAFTELHPRSGHNSRSHSSSHRSITNVSRTGLGDKNVPQSHQSPAGRQNIITTVAHHGSSSGSSHCSSHSSVPSPIQYDALSSSASSSRSAGGGGCPPVYCLVCGQSHDPSSAHRYNYTQAVDADLCCTLCHQPLVDPLDTKCGHTYCTPCLKSHLAVQALCPVDRQIINYLECQQASNIVKRLLDKLLVSCPNSQYCDIVVFRSNLEEHLKDWCPGTVVSCENAVRGCTFEGPRALYRHHRWKCPYHPISVGQLPTGQTVIGSPAGFRETGLIAHQVHATGPVLMSPHRSTAFSLRQPGRSLNPFHSQNFVPISACPSVSSRSELKPKHPNVNDSDDMPITEEDRPQSVVIHRSSKCLELGFTFVGGVDTPLSCIIIQEIYLDGAVALDGRLRPGDQILEVNGHIVTTCTHDEVRQLLSTSSSMVQLTIFREPSDLSIRRSAMMYSHEELFTVELCKRQNKVLGIKLVGKKHLPGLYVLELVPGCEAELDGRLKKDDQILEINGIDLSDGTQEQAAQIINSATEFVSFKVSRRTRADTPDILRTTNSSEEQVDISNSVRSLRLTSEVAKRQAPEQEQASVQDQSDADRIHRRSVDSQPTETSSLHAFHPPSSPSETFGVSNSTSQLLAEDEDKEINSIGLCFQSTEKKTDEGSIHSPLALHKDVQTSVMTCQDRTVTIKKAPEEPLGISVAGGAHSQRGDTPIYVTNINPECVLGRKNLVRRGDVLLEVNGIGLVGLTHNEAVDLLRRASLMKTHVQLRLISAPETSSGPDNFMPSWTFWLHLPPICQLARIIRLTRGIDTTGTQSSSGLEPLGFSIIGGLSEGMSTAYPDDEKKTQHVSERQKLGYTSLYPCPIVIKSIVPGLLAHRDGRLKCGDLILAVNKISMLNIPHSSAVRLLKQIPGDVALQIISWPGTIV
ncbi:unnamed protein product [Calicophoron daubneyi]|uniref:Uncharacterized protein n=1 Tax=Calicophoron daubneyi TaxID=300641 RepID=A0AAV2TYB1_CALDB